MRLIDTSVHKGHVRFKSPGIRFALFTIFWAWRSQESVLGTKKSDVFLRVDTLNVDLVEMVVVQDRIFFTGHG